MGAVLTLNGILHGIPFRFQFVVGNLNILAGSPSVRSWLLAKLWCLYVHSLWGLSGDVLSHPQGPQGPQTLPTPEWLQRGCGQL